MTILYRLAYLIRSFIWSITKPVTVGVKLLLVKDHSILLVRHTYQRELYLPGGGVNKGETLEQTARREALEELGAVLGKLTLFGVYTNFSEGRSDHIVVFTCNDFSFSGETDPEIESFGFVDVEGLPQDVSSGSKRRIEELREGLKPPRVGIW